MKKVCRCIMCPIGCTIEIIVDESGNIKEIKGGLCERGRKYAKSISDKRMQVLTTTIPLSKPVGETRVLPVKSDVPVNIDDMKKIVSALKKITVTPPVKVGTVIVENIEGVNVKIIATRSIGTP